MTVYVPGANEKDLAPLPLLVVIENEPIPPLPLKPNVPLSSMAVFWMTIVPGWTNVAVHALSVFIVTVTVLLAPEQLFDQPAKTEPEPAAAVNWTIVFCSYVSVQVPVFPVEQLIRPGLLVTVPLPLMVTESVRGFCTS